jgi:hypothetical protein
MGTMVRAECRCGFAVDEISIGGGMMDFTTRCNFPVYCNECKIMFVGNLSDKDIHCTKCNKTNITPYDDETMFVGGTEIETYLDESEKLGRDPQLTNGKYKCPNCSEFGMTFKEEGFFD